MIKKLKEMLTHKDTALFGAVCAVMGALGTFIIQDYTDFRSSRRENIKSQIEKSVDAQKELLNSLAKFSAKARGKGDVSTEDVLKFKENVREAYSTASAITVDIPTLKSDFKAYGDALISMQKSSENVKNNNTTKDFVEAVSEYDYTKNQFNTKVSSYLSSWP